MAKAPKTKRIPCVFCRGKGIQPGAERLSCIVCGGRGRVTVRQPYNVCKECAGTGKKAGAILYCLACQGKGFIEEKKHLSLAKSLVSKTRKKTRKRKKAKFSKRKRARKSMRMRKKGSRKSAKPKERKAKAANKGRTSFLKGFLGTFKML